MVANWKGFKFWRELKRTLKVLMNRMNFWTYKMFAKIHLILIFLTHFLNKKFNFWITEMLYPWCKNCLWKSTCMNNCLGTDTMKPRGKKISIFWNLLWVCCKIIIIIIKEPSCVSENLLEPRQSRVSKKKLRPAQYWF